MTLSPAVRARSWDVDLRWGHWLGVFIWLAAFGVAHRQTNRYLPARDPYLLPLAALLSGWGLITVWRLIPSYGFRQSVWLLVSLATVVVGLRLPSDLGFLRRYKYVWLSGSLFLTALTLFFGVNPLGYGPRMWLGCCGVYLQPSEPLKLLLIAYLAAYLADYRPFIASDISSRNQFLNLFVPPLIMTGLALALLIIQRDLGTASMILALYAFTVYVGSGRKRVLFLALLGIIAAGFAGYQWFDVVRVRVDAWLNPWLDPSGRSYQIVQGLMAVANGGLLGRGLGMGNPGLVPVVHSDMVYTALAEEFGMIGSIGLLLLLALLTSRGLRAALHAPDAYQRYLAAGLTTYLAGQSLLIIAGNLRLAPLTGITLPFVSYGGSSLLTSFLSLLILLHISHRGERMPALLRDARPYFHVGAFLYVGFLSAALATGWWAVYRAPVLLARTDNPRRAITDRSVQRGAILDRRSEPINASQMEAGSFVRKALYPPLSNVVGYTNPTYGQSGLEVSLDDYLRGLRGNPGLLIWWNHLLYGQPPPGLDVRLSLDLDLQRVADDLLGDHKGALVLLNAASGEILVMASHPTFDANRLEEQWDAWVGDPTAPLLNRATLGRYPLGDLENELLGDSLADLGLDAQPQIRLPVTYATGFERSELGYSPLQVALMAAALSAGGVRPAPILVMAVNTPRAGWVQLPALEDSRQILPLATAETIISRWAVEKLPIWRYITVVHASVNSWNTWCVGGTLSSWGGAPLAIAVLLEQDQPALAEHILQKVLEGAMQP